jgi:hypothetical protein
MRFQESVKLGGNAAEVWKRASTVKDIPKYWHGTRSLYILRDDGSVVRAKIKFAFGGSGEADIFIDREKRMLTIDYTSGPFTGKQTIAVDESSITAMWDVRFRSIFRLASKWNQGHFRSGTVHALERLVGGLEEGATPVSGA